jgi:hypothetical protein
MPKEAMRKAAMRRRCRNGVVCFFVGLLVVDAVLAVGIECFWLGVRDPAYADLISLARERRREMPDRPLAMMLGSSSTYMGVDGDRLSRPGDVLFLNCGIPGAGPIEQQIMLRRFLADGVRPDLLFVEILPYLLGCQPGDRISFEERSVISPRLTYAELSRVKRYTVDRGHYDRPWLFSRLMPLYFLQSELRRTFGTDLVPNPGRPSGRDNYGFDDEIRSAILSPEVTRKATDLWMGRNRRALEGEGISETSRRSLRDLFDLCRKEKLEPRIVIPPMRLEVLRAAPEKMKRQCAELVRIAEEYGYPIIDARNWVDDADFWDGVHMQAIGAEHYSDRLRRDALAPALAARNRLTSPERTVPADPVSRTGSAKTP